MAVAENPDFRGSFGAAMTCAIGPLRLRGFAGAYGAILMKKSLY
jgi:hypothetical protein